MPATGHFVQRPMTRAQRVDCGVWRGHPVWNYELVCRNMHRPGGRDVERIVPVGYMYLIEN